MSAPGESFVLAGAVSASVAMPRKVSLPPYIGCFGFLRDGWGQNKLEGLAVSCISLLALACPFEIFLTVGECTRPSKAFSSEPLWLLSDLSATVIPSCRGTAKAKL